MSGDNTSADEALRRPTMGGSNKAFVMIPYEASFDNVFEKAIGPAVGDAGLTATLVKEEQYVGAVYERVVVRI